MGRMARTIIDAIPRDLSDRPSEVDGLYEQDEGECLREVRALLAAGADANAEVEGKLPLHWAVIQARPAFVLDGGADPNLADRAYGMTPLMQAAWARSRHAARLCRMLLDRGARVDARNGSGGTALHCAAGEENLDVIRLLLDRGADVNARDAAGHTPVWSAETFKRAAAAKLLRSRGGA